MLSRNIIAGAREKAAKLTGWTKNKLSHETLMLLHAQACDLSVVAHYRDAAVWVDGKILSCAKLIPAPSSAVAALLQDFFAFLRRDDVGEPLKLALSYYQLLMIHPFADGNGRLSRALACVQSQYVVGAARSFAIAGALAIHRRELRPLLDEVRNGHLENYLKYWQRLINWSTQCVCNAAQEREAAKYDLMFRMSPHADHELICEFLLDNPIFRESALGALIHRSRRTAERVIETLIACGAIERHPDLTHQDCVRCSRSVHLWERIQSAAMHGAAELLPASARA